MDAPGTLQNLEDDPAFVHELALYSALAETWGIPLPLDCTIHAGANRILRQRR